MIREVCSCGAEFETDLPEQIDLAKNWRRTHKHSAEKITQKDSSILSTTDTVTMGFRAEMPLYADDDE